MTPDYTLLQDPFRSALRTEQQQYALGNSRIVKFPGRILPFLGMETYQGSILDEILPWLEPEEEFYLKDQLDSVPENWTVTARVPVMQMVCRKSPELPDGSEKIELLGEADFPALFELVNLVQPGYFRPETHVLGDYYGIRKDGVLIAVAGERLKMTGFVEVSAVCTHPDHTGKGLARQLTGMVCRQIFEQGKVPILHVLDSNSRAIRLYERLNFEKSMDFPLLKMKSK